MISAQEIRDMMAQDRTEGDLKALEELIKTAAAKGKRCVRVPYELMETSGYSANFKGAGVEDALKCSGYVVETQIEERQFVDIWLEISW